MKRISSVVVLLLGVCVMLSNAAAEVEIHEQQGIRYVSGGGTAESDEEMKQLAARFPVHLVFVAKGVDEPIEGVKVTVRDVKGTAILEATSEGPLFFVDVGSGRYTVDAEYAGEMQSQTKDLTGRRYLRLRYTFNE